MSRYEFEIYGKRGITLVRGKNARVWDDVGTQYIDCMSGHGVASVGHANRQVARAIAAQADTLITCAGAFDNDRRRQLMERLSSLLPHPLNRVFLCNSGAESVEAALKFARFATGKTDFICANRGFHGRTLGALSATFQPKYKTPFEPLAPGFRFVPYNRFDALEKAVSRETAGIILEAVQGEGGVHPGDADYFHQVRRLCDRRGILLILDEVQTGFCRTGKWFAFQHLGVVPDMICLAKAMAGGFPMGAVVCREDLASPRGNHGSTFGGNPLACAASLATLDFMEKHRLHERAARLGTELVNRLELAGLSRVRQIRGLGLMTGIELKERVQPFLAALAERGVLALPAGKTVLRLLPPLTIGHEDLVRATELILEVLSR